MNNLFTLLMIAALAGIFLLLSQVGVVHNPGRLQPGQDGVQETQRQTEQVGEAVDSFEFTFVPEGDYDALANVSVQAGAWIAAASGGSASTAIASVHIDSVSLTAVVVTVTLDAAPGAGETTDIACSVSIAGPGAR